VNKYAVFGCPGAGKTTACVDIIADLVGKRVPMEQISYISFTNAAVNEALDRVGITERAEAPYFGTLHRLCRRSTGIDVRNQLIRRSHMRDFSKKLGLEITGELPDWDDPEAVMARLIQQRPREEGDLYFQAYALARLMSGSIAELAKAKVAPPKLSWLGGLDPAVYQSFVRQYEAFKKRENLADFTDMLARVVTEGFNGTDLNTLIVDETQDLSPLGHACVDRISDFARNRFLVGDDDQAIYGWSGSSAREFLQRANEPGTKKIILGRTHRFGPEIAQYAQRIIRKVKDRQEKELLPDPEKSNTIEMLARLDLGELVADGRRYMVLHRHVAGCQKLGYDLIEAGVPFVNERGPSPLSKGNEIKAFSAYMALATTGRVQWFELAMMKSYIPSIMKTERGRTRLLKHGTKKHLDAMEEPNRIWTMAQLEAYFEPVLIKAIRDRELWPLKCTYLKYYSRLWEKHGTLSVEPNVTITTIHGSKGRQEENIVLYSEVNGQILNSPLANWDEEHRLAYVGSTRTKGSLRIVDDVTEDWRVNYPYPSLREEVPYA